MISATTPSAPKRNRSRRLSLGRIGLSAATLALLWRQVGGRQVWAILRGARPELLAAAWGLFLVGIVIRTFRWRSLLGGLGIRPPLWKLGYLYLVGSFFNAFLPSGFGGDVVRVLELRHDARDAAVIGTVLVDRLTGILSLMALGLLALPFALHTLAPWLIALVGLTAVGGLVGGALLLEGRWLRRLTARLPPALSLAGEGALARIYAAVTGCGPSALRAALLLSTLFNLTNVLVYWLCGLAVGIPLGVDFYAVVTPLLSLALLLPISVGGLGARDWVAQPLFRSAGVGGAYAAGMTLAVYAVSAAVGLIGGILYLGQGVWGLLRRR